MTHLTLHSNANDCCTTFQIAYGAFHHRFANLQSCILRPPISTTAFSPQTQAMPERRTFLYYCFFASGCQRHSARSKSCCVSQAFAATSHDLLCDGDVGGGGEVEEGGCGGTVGGIALMVLLTPLSPLPPEFDSVEAVVE